MCTLYTNMSIFRQKEGKSMDSVNVTALHKGLACEEHALLSCFSKYLACIRTLQIPFGRHG